MELGKEVEISSWIVIVPIQHLNGNETMRVTFHLTRFTKKSNFPKG